MRTKATKRTKTPVYSELEDVKSLLALCGAREESLKKQNALLKDALATARADAMGYTARIIQGVGLLTVIHLRYLREDTPEEFKLALAQGLGLNRPSKTYKFDADKNRWFANSDVEEAKDKLALAT